MFKMKEFGFKSDTPTGIRENGKYTQNRSYVSWINMISRCYNKNNDDYKTYGGAGIYVCEEWKLYSNYKTWFDENYIDGCVVDKDLSGLGYYGPDACVFISASNNSKEAMSRRDYSSTSGDNHPKSKSVEWFELNETNRANFKATCKVRGWNFNDFEETFFRWHIKPNGHRVSMYKYKKGESK